MEELVITGVSSAGGGHLALKLRNCSANCVEMGILRYAATDKTGRIDNRSTPNGMPIKPGETVEIFIEIDDSIRRVECIDYLNGHGAIPVRGRIDAGLLRWKLRPRQDDQ
jgi:hypothetical protein